MFLAFGSLGCGIGYGYLHRIPTQPPSHHKKPPGGPPPGAPPPGPGPQDSPAPFGLETGSKQGDYVEVRGEHWPAGARGEFHVGRGACSWERRRRGLSSPGAYLWSPWEAPRLVGPRRSRWGQSRDRATCFDFPAPWVCR